MKTAALFSLLACLAAPGIASGSSSGGPGISVVGKLNSPFIPLHGGTAYLQLIITTPDVGSSKRRPMNLSVVLDRSGSMADEGKIEYAKRALYSLIDQLSENDILSVVIYDDVIEVLRPAQHVGDKRELKRIIQGIYPRGSTNLGGGMAEGFHQAEQNVRKEYVNRVVLLSDGLANTGITSPSELNRIARRYRSKSIALTTMGVGLDYNENLMVSLAENGGGNYYFIESPHSLASIMRKEFNLLSSLCAHGVVLELNLGHRIVMNDVIGTDWSSNNGRFFIPVGELYSNDQREFTVELGIPARDGSSGENLGPITIASGTVRYESDQSLDSKTTSFTATVNYTADVAVVEKHRDMDVQGKADVAVSTRSVEHAMKALDDGKPEEAAEKLQEARQALSSSPAAATMGAGGAAVRNQEQMLDSFKSMVKDSAQDARRAKKAIQYQNYKTQKGRN
ncbi:MAG: VWA domain-containing protein [Bacteroidota bacterium]